MTATAKKVWAENAGRWATRDRSGGRCEVSQWDRGVECSHRLARSQGGTWAPWNLLDLDGLLHRWLHDNPHLAVAGGWHVLPGVDPLTVPVWLARPWPGWWIFRIPRDGGPHVLEPWAPADGLHHPQPVLPGWVP